MNIKGKRTMVTGSSNRHNLDTSKKMTNSRHFLDNPTLVNNYMEDDPYIEHLSFKYCNALHIAAYFGHLDVIDILLTRNR